MDIQKEKEAFEQWFEENNHTHFMQFAILDGVYQDKHSQTCWEAWQASKAQAIPEGFVLVPREPTEEMLGAAWEAPPAGGPSGNRRAFYEKQAVVYKAMVEEAEKEMTEAQEQG